MKKIVFSVGSQAFGSPVEQGRGAALAAMSRAGKLPPSLAILVGSDPADAAEVLRGAREVLGTCPLLGAVAAAAEARPGAPCPPGARLLLVASEHLRAKVGVGSEGAGGWEREVRDAFKDSYISSTVPGLPEGAPERNLYRWYLYRRPSLLLAVIVSRADERIARERHVAAFLRHRLGGSTPIICYSLVADGVAPAAMADGRVITGGVILTMIKTDLKFSVERLSAADPDRGELVIARAEEDRGLEHPLEIACGGGLATYLAPGAGDAAGGRVQITFHRELDPVAVAAAENERLLREIVQLKDLHQRIFDGIGYGIAVIDGARRVVFCNNTYRELLAGAAGAALAGGVCPWSEGEGPVCRSCAAEETIARDVAASREVVRLVDGGSRWYRLDTFPLRDEAGPGSAIEVMRDVTAFKNLRSSLESEQGKMAAVLRGMGETLYIVNGAYDLQFFHRGGFPRDVVVGGEAGERKCHRAIFRREMPCPWCRLPETLASGGVERRLAHLPGASGEEQSYQVTFSPWGAGQGNQGSVVCLLVDISSQKRLEQQMVQSEKLNSLSILSAGMAHELNNPLGAINFNLEILKRRERDQEYQAVLESIRKDVLRINRIVGNLLSFSRSSAVSSGSVELPAVVDSALEIFQVVVERRGIEVRKSWEEGLPPVWGNVQDLQQVFINLIANAIDAMPSGGTITIEIGLEAQAARAAGSLIAVVYDNAADLSLLRALMDVPGWEVRFFNGDEEAIDFFRQNPETPPALLILDYSETSPERVGFLAMMAKECAPDVRILVIADRPDGGRPPSDVPNAAGFLTRPLRVPQMLEQVRTMLEGSRERQQPAEEIVVRFADTGIGIPADILERIFDPFFTTKDVKGTGLGLSVVHKILENHGASIRVRSSPGKGTQFTLRFPQVQDPGIPFKMQQHDGGLRRIVR